MTKLQVFGTWHKIPRKKVTYGDPGLSYTYSGVTFHPKPWIPVLTRIRERITSETGHTFNFVLINRYSPFPLHKADFPSNETKQTTHAVFEFNREIIIVLLVSNCLGLKDVSAKKGRRFS